MARVDELFDIVREALRKNPKTHRREYCLDVWNAAQAIADETATPIDRDALLIASVFHYALFHLSRNEVHSLSTAKLSANRPKLIALGFSDASVSTAIVCTREYRTSLQYGRSNPTAMVFSRAVHRVNKDK